MIPCIKYYRNITNAEYNFGTINYLRHGRRQHKEVSTTEANKWQHIEWVEFKEELKKVSSIAGPMVAVSVMQYLLQVVSVMMVGHLGKLALSSIAIATSLTNVTGFSPHVMLYSQ